MHCESRPRWPLIDCFCFRASDRKCWPVFPNRLKLCGPMRCSPLRQRTFKLKFKSLHRPAAVQFASASVAGTAAEAASSAPSWTPGPEDSWNYWWSYSGKLIGSPSPLAVVSVGFNANPLRPHASYTPLTRWPRAGVSGEFSNHEQWSTWMRQIRLT